ncbi:MAG: heme exporter protein CcmD [Pseudomonadota bacterium]
MNWSEFFHMGGYAFYVWTSWGLSLLVLVWQVLQPKLSLRRIKRDIARQVRREQTHGTATN